MSCITQSRSKIESAIIKISGLISVGKNAPRLAPINKMQVYNDVAIPLSFISDCVATQTIIDGTAYARPIISMKWKKYIIESKFN